MHIPSAGAVGGVAGTAGAGAGAGTGAGTGDTSSQLLNFSFSSA